MLAWARVLYGCPVHRPREHKSNPFRVQAQCMCSTASESIRSAAEKIISGGVSAQQFLSSSPDSAARAYFWCGRVCHGPEFPFAFPSSQVLTGLNNISFPRACYRTYGFCAPKWMGSDHASIASCIEGCIDLGWPGIDTINGCRYLTHVNPRTLTLTA